MDHYPETRVEILDACPDCEPDRDVRRYQVRHCSRHEPAREGVDDAAVEPSYLASGSNDAGGPGNAAMCDLLHRKRILLR